MPIKSFQAARQKLIPKRRKSLLVRDYMTRDLITFSPQQSILEVMRILIRNKISGGPVLDEFHDRVGTKLNKKTSLSNDKEEMA